MKRLVSLLAFTAISLFAQEGHEAQQEGAGHESAAHESGDPYVTYKWFNFAILAAGLGYLAVKFGGPALRNQQQDILDQLNQASKRAETAAAEAAEVDRKVSGLQAEIEAIRRKAAAEMTAEVARSEKETAQLLAKVEQAGLQEIASASKHAQQQLKAQAAQLAIELAAQKVSAQMNPEIQSALVGRFVDRLKQSPEARN